ncbi:hypothetical protein FBZ93_109332 [Bradyrhizobium macuxiense]|uniref:Phenol degradation protein meta n=1 Tax=Bradyrhizobium macuxiense TaxID=1755647 RepID=A0A560LI05_9BRAD|nr:transporter [Bradyrhizobium macuxiense]TWB94892.1 hypothetical protein FBZ93_109332 [Bradyrhizobium macuxiense]
MLSTRIFTTGLTVGLAIACTEASAFEAGYIGSAQKPGLVLGNAAITPPAGLYMFDQAVAYSGSIVGPGAPTAAGDGKTSVHIAAGAAGLLWVPGWTVFGATYDAVIVQPFMMLDVGSPVNVNPLGMHNTFLAPAELSWKLADSGVYVKSGFGMWMPTGTTSGSNGLGNVGAPWWTFQPNLVVSYFKDGWNLTANLFEEINTASSVTGYTSGNVLHAEFTATKTIGNWTFGPVGYYVGQVSDDKSSAFYGGAVNLKRYDIWAAGALVGYNFGPAALSVWATHELSANVSGGTAVPGIDSAAVSRGFTVFANLSYRLWAPDAPAPAPTRTSFRK